MVERYFVSSVRRAMARAGLIRRNAVPAVPAVHAARVGDSRTDRDTLFLRMMRRSPTEMHQRRTQFHRVPIESRNEMPFRR